MKFFRNILLAVLTLLLVSGLGGYFYMRKKFEPAANQLVVEGLPTDFHFEWHAGGTQPANPRASLLIPVTLPGCPRTCYMQFDTGSPSTLLYANSLAALRKKYPATAQRLLPHSDTIHNFTCTLGQATLQARWLRALQYGASELPTDSTVHFIIGTLGADVLDGRALVLNYAQQRFSLNAQLPDSLARHTAFVPLSYEGRRVLLQAQVQGKPQQLLFDSGSSAFALLTSQATWQQMAQPQAPVQTTASNSMGRKLTTYTTATAQAVQLNNLTVPLGTVTYVEGTSLMQNTLMRFSGMGGMLGNAPFSQRTIVLDVRGGRFGLVQ
ncbi:hypothetical protein HMJ29_07390 [Hymenobacter taeanensis]|uniref:Aspartyl protease n=1 Tax=Hymenobacter taeanensis TaxID=2735321 RepID=A0A6M6BE01_9BACT|nr:MULTISPECIES: hypothetical protein [Hymenobacter]QJX46771.1 hypothetical protein HMJ29_07390 [Hymenobacter taeanensis]UOQ80640.1 hypothetical protein MUN83_17735 [Hymenobacter sp. 5414T-23]